MKGRENGVAWCKKERALTLCTSPVIIKLWQSDWLALIFNLQPQQEQLSLSLSLEHSNESRWCWLYPDLGLLRGDVSLTFLRPSVPPSGSNPCSGRRRAARPAGRGQRCWWRENLRERLRRDCGRRDHVLQPDRCRGRSSKAPTGRHVSQMWPEQPDIVTTTKKGGGGCNKLVLKKKGTDSRSRDKSVLEWNDCGTTLELRQNTGHSAERLCGRVTTSGI